MIRRRAQLCILPGLLALLAVHIQPAFAGCGASLCSLNSNWDASGQWSHPGLRLDLRLEYIDQDQPRSGTRNVELGEIHRHHDEQRTLNRNLVASLDYNASPDWGISVQVPVVARDHDHLHNHHGAVLPEQWSLRALGDVRVIGRHQFTGGNGAAQSGVNIGVKLPTGATDRANDEGDIAERSLQPGSGTTDFLGGLYLHGSSQAGGRPWYWFVQGQLQVPLAEPSDYRPGNQLQLDVGANAPLSKSVNGLLQLNVTHRGRDSGLEAEPEDSGGTFVYLSPGMAWAVGRDTSFYTYLQLPLYQHVNGVQITSEWAAVAGISMRLR